MARSQRKQAKMHFFSWGKSLSTLILELLNHFIRHFGVECLYQEKTLYCKCWRGKKIKMLLESVLSSIIQWQILPTPYLLLSSWFPWLWETHQVDFKMWLKCNKESTLPYPSRWTVSDEISQSLSCRALGVLPTNRNTKTNSTINKKRNTCWWLWELLLWIKAILSDSTRIGLMKDSLNNHIKVPKVLKWEGGSTVQSNVCQKKIFVRLIPVATALNCVTVFNWN